MSDLNSSNGSPLVATNPEISLTKTNETDDLFEVASVAVRELSSDGSEAVPHAEKLSDVSIPDRSSHSATPTILIQSGTSANSAGEVTSASQSTNSSMSSLSFSPSPSLPAPIHTAYTPSQAINDYLAPKPNSNSSSPTASPNANSPSNTLSPAQSPTGSPVISGAQSPRDRQANQSTSHPQLFGDGRRPFFVSRDAISKPKLFPHLPPQPQLPTSTAQSSSPDSNAPINASNQHQYVRGGAMPNPRDRRESQGRVHGLQLSNQEYAAKLSGLSVLEEPKPVEAANVWNTATAPTDVAPTHDKTLSPRSNAQQADNPSSTTATQQAQIRTPSLLKATMTASDGEKDRAEQEANPAQQQPKESGGEKQHPAMVKSPSKGNLLQRKLSIGRLLHATTSPASNTQNTNTASSTATKENSGNNNNTTTVNASGVEISALKLDEAHSHADGERENREEREGTQFASPPQSPKGPRLFRTSSFGISKSSQKLSFKSKDSEKDKVTASEREKSVSTSVAEQKLSTSKSASTLRFDLNKGGPAKELMAINLLFGKNGRKFLPMDSPLDLVFVLYHSYFERHFVEYLQRCFSSENLDFWLAAVQYLKTKSREKRKVMAQDMLTTFFHQESTREVNVPDPIHRALLAKAQNGDLDLFDEARYHIWDLLYYDAYSRYILLPDFEAVYQTVLNKRKESLDLYAEQLNGAVLTDIFSRLELGALTPKNWKLDDNYQGISIFSKKADTKLSDSFSLKGKSAAQLPSHFKGLKTSLEMEVPPEIMNKVLFHNLSSFKRWSPGFSHGEVIEMIDDFTTIQYWQYHHADVSRDFVVLRRIITSASPLAKIIEKECAFLMLSHKSFIVIEKSVTHNDVPVRKDFMRCNIRYHVRVVAPSPNNFTHCRLDTMVLFDSKLPESYDVKEEAVNSAINLERLGKEFMNKWKDLRSATAAGSEATSGQSTTAPAPTHSNANSGAFDVL